jgi:hypothetical protein
MRAFMFQQKYGYLGSTPILVLAFPALVLAFPA